MNNENKILVDIKDYLFLLVKNKMYDIIEHFENEEMLDKLINIAIEKFIRGGFPLVYLFFLYDKNKIKEFAIDNKYDIIGERRKIISNIEEFLKQYTPNIQLLCFTMQNINKKFYAVIIFISKKWAKIFAIPLKKVITPSEGEFFAVDQENIQAIEFKAVKSSDINFDLNFYEYLK